MIKIDESKEFAIDNVVRQEKELKEPYGAYRIKHYDSVATQCGSLSNESEYNDLVKNIKDNDSLIESASVSKLLNENIITETLK
jgi:hypothetical protein